ncbi:MAG: type II toxin-antitoxin system RelE/ParE family toxin [Limisphaerales bacterium]
MVPTRQVIFAPQAFRDLKSTVAYISRHSSPEIATKVGIELVEKSLSLSSMPERGRIVPEIGLPYREIISRSYRIVYRLSARNVEVIRFWHAARGVPQINSDEFC